MCFHLALCASASSVFSATAVASPCCRSAESYCRCLLSEVPLPPSPKRILVLFGAAHAVASRCFLSRDLPLRNLTRNRWKRDFTLTARNCCRVPTNTTVAPAPALYVCLVAASYNKTGLFEHATLVANQISYLPDNSQTFPIRSLHAQVILRKSV